MTKVLECKDNFRNIVPFDIPRGIWSFSRLENILVAINKLKENSSNILDAVIGYDRIRVQGIIESNYRVMPKEYAKRLKSKDSKGFDYCTLDYLLDRKEQIEKAQRGENSRYIVHDGLIIRLNSNYKE